MPAKKKKKPLHKSSPPRPVHRSPKGEGGRRGPVAQSSSRKARRRTFSFKKRNFAAHILIAIIALIGLFFSYKLWIQSPIAEPTEINVPGGASIIQTGRILQEQNLINNQHLFRASVHLWGGRIHTGLYDIRPGQSVWTIARNMTRGRVAMIAITIPEGLTVKQIYEIIGHHPHLTGQVRILFKNGELFPETYHFPKGADRNAVLTAMANKMETIRKRFEDKPFPHPIQNWNELLSLAAIIQKETPKKHEMPQVSGVFVNRLRRGMLLQADPTVVYAITDGFGHMQGRGITRRHLQIDSPYNTYRYRGLPPTPIANPGLAAIQAAFEPEQHNLYYFVADGTGGHIFAETYEQHRENHAQWRIIRARINSGDSPNP
ncbi:MAG: endolytic transglycosylase MltG [Alphaproteobacteria bacterium]|nr:endolytic transglycosylase MltG [Alphaproteobacteria bacterium]